MTGNNKAQFFKCILNPSGLKNFLKANRVEKRLCKEGFCLSPFTIIVTNHRRLGYFIKYRGLVNSQF
jgi:hypothetical protein